MVVAEQQYNQQMQENFLKDQLNVDQLVEKIVWKLRGYRWDPVAKEHTNKISDSQGNEITSEPMLNELGVMYVATELSSRIQNAFGSASLDRWEIDSIRDGVGEVLADNLDINRKRFEIKVENLKSILFIVDDELKLFLSRTEKGGFFTKLVRMFSVKETRNVTTTESQQQGGMFKKQQSGGGLF